MQKVLGQHAYFGEVIVDRGHLSAEGPAFEGRRLSLSIVLADTDAERQASIDAVTSGVAPPEAEVGYDRVAPLLAKFQVFCEALPAKDRIAQDYFARSWPKSAGEFELSRLVLVEEGVDWQGERDFSFLEVGPFGLRYEAHDGDAWQYAGNYNWPPEFQVVFDASGAFISVEEDVDTRYKALPETIEPLHLEDSYSHPYFGEFDLRESDTLKTIIVDGREVEVELYMDRKAQGEFEPKQLDQFVPLLDNLAGIDAQVRAHIPEETRLDWLGDRMEFDADERTEQLAQMFPGAKTPEDVSPEAFAKALWLDRISLSLSPGDSGGAAMTLDYLIFPVDEDGEIFAAKVSADGKLMDVALES